MNEKHTKTIRELGFDPDVGFVRIRGNVVGFSCGKPQEIQSLYRAVIAAAGLKPSRGLSRIGGSR